jgi:hypothetical protein
LEPARFGQSRRIGALDDPPNPESLQSSAHRAETFKLSTDPLFVEKVRDIAGLYLSPPNAPLSCAFRAFLNVIEANVPGDLDVHVIMDTVSTYKTQAIRNWFAKRPRWRTHYTPTSASWISLVERFFANLTEKQTRRGAHRSTEELEAAIVSYIDAVNAKPRPFVWTKSADDILASRLPGRGPDPHPLDLGFLGPWPFRCENRWPEVLDSLGYPWILSTTLDFSMG